MTGSRTLLTLATDWQTAASWPIAATDLDIQGTNALPDLDPEEDASPSQEIPDDTFQVERIVKHRQKKGKNEYLIKWLGFPKSQNTW